jgi:hydrogenase nickel incorporation protein HypB
MKQRIPVVEKILDANDQLALENENTFVQGKIFSMNFMASPGAGKTSLIEITLRELGNSLQVGVIDGDIATSIDADRAAAAGARALQINTGGDCHLDAMMVRQALTKMDLENLDLMIVENVGNLVCPASFKLGTHKNVLIASVPEGDDKPYKYPGMYRGVDAVILNKIDLLPYVDFSVGHFFDGVEILNPGVQSFELSCRTGEGINAWIDWIQAQTLEFKTSLSRTHESTR